MEDVLGMLLGALVSCATMGTKGSMVAIMVAASEWCG
jgi:hypothetical protein